MVRLHQLLDPEELDDLFRINGLKVELYRKQLQEKKSEKIQELKEKKGSIERQTVSTTHHFFQRVVNDSSINLSRYEAGLLPRCLRYTIPPLHEQRAKDTIIADLVSSCSKYPGEVNKNLSEIIHRHSIPTATKELQKTLRSLTKKINVNCTIITEADKDNTIVLSSHEEYDVKMKECLRSVCDPTFDFDDYNDEVRDAIKGSEEPM